MTDRRRRSWETLPAWYCYAIALIGFVTLAGASGVSGAFADVGTGFGMAAASADSVGALKQEPSGPNGCCFPFALGIRTRRAGEACQG
jgi:hypothetical protein